jgi:hypothetical protein
LPLLPARNSKPVGISKQERNLPPRIDQETTETATSPPPVGSQAESMQSLEKKLNEIAGELKELRRELDAQKKPASSTRGR